jgi:hypothetical protein
MKKPKLDFLILIMVLLTYTVYGQTKEPGGGSSLYNLRPANGELVVIGMAPRQSTREKSIQAALEDAAKKIALFHGVQGEITKLTADGSGYLDFSYDNDISLEYDRDFQKYIDALHYDPQKDVFNDGANYYVYVRFNAPHSLEIDYTTIFTNDKPNWIANPPRQISGYTATVGYSGKLKYLRDRTMKSYENAIANMISSIHTEVQEMVNSYEHNSGATASKESVQLSKGKLANFFVIELWIDPKDQSVWTLAVGNMSDE